MPSNCNASTEENKITSVQTALYLAAFLTSLLLLIISACVRFRRRISIERTETQFVAVGCVLLLYSFFSSFHWIVLYDNSRPAEALCTAVAFFTQYSLLSLLVATNCIGVHLLLLLWQPKFLRVIEEQKRQRYKYLEILYVVLIIFLPFIFLPWPFIHNLYGSTGHLCWIKIRDSYNHNYSSAYLLPGFIEQIVLYYLWSFLAFSFTSVVAVVVMFTICWHTPRKGTANVYTLLCYLVIFVAANAVGLSIRIYNWVERPVQSCGLELAQSIIFPLRTGFIAGVLLIRVCFIYKNLKSEYKRLVYLN